MHRYKCTTITVPYFTKDLIRDIGDRNFILIIEVSNDVSVTKLLSVVIRYYFDANKEFV